MEIDKDNLFLTRRKKKITLKMVANRIGCSVSMLSLYENDKCNLDINKQIKYQNFISDY